MSYEDFRSLPYGELKALALKVFYMRLRELPLYLLFVVISGFLASFVASFIVAGRASFLRTVVLVVAFYLIYSYLENKRLRYLDRKG
jgi:hypothetical protein